MTILFLLLAVLVFIEASTSLARAAGFLASSPYAGLTLQGSLAIVSRFVIFMYSPLLGFLADTSQINSDRIVLIPFLYLFIPLGLLLVCGLQAQILSLYLKLISTSLSHGRWLKRPAEGYKKTLKEIVLAYNQLPRSSAAKLKIFKKIKIITLLLYAPYYAAWPVTFLLIAQFADYRATFLSFSTICTAINTIGITLWLDPLLLKMQKQKRISIAFLQSLVYTRIESSLIVFVFILLIVFLFSS